MVDHLDEILVARLAAWKAGEKAFEKVVELGY